jgi:hypothetical protein
MCGQAMSNHDLSSCAWSVLNQLKQRPTWDGDLISKSGRTELTSKGLAQRGTYRGCDGMNWLTDAGQDLAVRMAGADWDGDQTPREMRS